MSDNINDTKAGILQEDGTMQINELSGVATQATGNVNDMEHSSIIESGGEFFRNIISD